MDKLLWQIELVPPEASNLKSVSQVLNKYQESSASGAKTTRKTRREMKRTSETAEEYAMRLDEIRRKINLAEEGSRFFNKSTDEGITTIKSQGDELMKLRAQIEANVDSRKDRLKLLKRADAGVKRSQLSISRLRNNFTSMSASINQGNNTLISTGRILQDLPYGFIGISNNIEQLAFNFRNLTSSINPKTGKQRGFVGALSAVKSQFFGSGGLLFVLGSALPFALTTATAGFPGFRNMMGDTGDDVDDLKGALGELVGSLESYYKLEGEDPLGIRNTEAQLESVRSIITNVDEWVEARETLNSLETSALGMYGGIDQFHGEQIDSLEEIIAQTKERTGLSDEQLEKLEDQKGSLQDQLATLEKFGEITPLQSFAIETADAVDQVVKRHELGIERITSAGITSFTEGSLNALEKRLSNTVANYRDLIEAGDVSKIPFLEIALDNLEKVQDALDDLSDESSNIEQATVEPLESFNQAFTKFEVGLEGSRQELLNHRTLLQTYIDSWSVAVQQGNMEVLPYLKNAKDLMDSLNESLFVSVDDAPDLSEIMDFRLGDNVTQSLSEQVSEAVDLDTVRSVEQELEFSAQLAQVDGFEAEKLKIQRKYEKKRQKLIEAGISESIASKMVEKAEYAEIEQAKTENAEKEQKRRQELFKQSFTAITGSATELFGALSELNQAQSDETEAQARKRFQTQKKLSIASAVVSSLEAFTVALADGEVPPLIRTIRAGTILASGIAKVQAIKRQKFNSSGVSGEMASRDQGFDQRSLEDTNTPDSSGMLAESARLMNQESSSKLIREVSKVADSSKSENIYITVDNDITQEKLDGFVRRGRNKKTSKAIEIRSD